MYITKCLQHDADKFEPCVADVLEAHAMGVSDLTITPDENTVALLKGDSVLALGGNTGDQVWFLTSAEVGQLSLKERLEFRRLIMDYRDLMLTRYPTLWNYVWLGNKAHRRFLKSIGATFKDEYLLDGQFQLFIIN